jgi:hypothetical protein
MSLQQIINLSDEISVDRSRVSSVQYTRSGIARTSDAINKNPWRFTVSVGGRSYDTMRGVLESLNSIGRTDPETVSFGNHPQMEWLYRYQGDLATTPTGITVTSFIGDQMVIGNLPVLASTSLLFKSGDIIQVTGKPYPFTIVGDVLRGSGSSVTLTTHRPNIITSGVAGATLIVGSACSVRVFCPNMPNYKIINGAQRYLNGVLTNRGIVEFTEAFQLVEYLAEA